MTDWPKPELLERMRKAFEEISGDGPRFPVTDSARPDEYVDWETQGEWQAYIAGYKRGLLDFLGLPIDELPDGAQDLRLPTSQPIGGWLLAALRMKSPERKDSEPGTNP
jgi:hypothetical protein